MSRYAPHQRKRPEISKVAWDLVTGETLLEDSEGRRRSAVILIYSWYRDWLRGVTQQPLTWAGTPLRADFRWISPGTFNGRAMTDLAGELEAVALEATAKAVMTVDLRKAPLIPWMKKVLHNTLASEFRFWCDSSSSTNATREDHRSVDELLAAEGSKYSVWAPELVLGSTDLSPETVLGLNEEDAGPYTNVNQDMVRIALEALTAIESEALQLFAEGNSYGEISRTLQLSGPTSAHRIVERAAAKAREALA